MPRFPPPRAEGFCSEWQVPTEDRAGEVMHGQCTAPVQLPAAASARNAALRTPAWATAAIRDQPSQQLVGWDLGQGVKWLVGVWRPTGPPGCSSIGAGHPRGWRQAILHEPSPLSCWDRQWTCASYPQMYHRHGAVVPSPHHF